MVLHVIPHCIVTALRKHCHALSEDCSHLVWQVRAMTPNSSSMKSLRGMLLEFGVIAVPAKPALLNGVQINSQKVW